MVVSFLVAALGAQAAEPPADKPDVVLVLWNGARADHVSAHGYSRATTPVLDGIAAEGVVFEQAISAAPSLLPSLASVFTGQFVHKHTVEAQPGKAQTALPADRTTLAEALKAQGYATALYTTKGSFTKKDGFLDGFDEWRQTGDNRLAPLAKSWIMRNRDKPVFIVVFYHGAAFPWDAAAPHDQWRDPSSEDLNVRPCPKDASRFPATWLCFADINKGEVELSPAQWNLLGARYDAELHRTDAYLEELWAGLRTQRTLFVLTADTGMELGEHGRVGQSLPYEPVIHVPLVVRGPGFSPGRVPHAVRTVDIFPTVLEAAGATAEHAVDGVSLAKVDGPRAAVGMSRPVGAPAFLRENGYKLVFGRAGRPLSAVYSLQADPAEKTNLAETEAERLAALKARYEELTAP